MVLLSWSYWGCPFTTPAGLPCLQLKSQHQVDLVAGYSFVLSAAQLIVTFQADVFVVHSFFQTFMLHFYNCVYPDDSCCFLMLFSCQNTASTEYRILMTAHTVTINVC